MDSVPRYEFHTIFDRVSATIDLKGCTTALAIELALREVRDKSKAKLKFHRGKVMGSEFGRKVEWLDTLIEKDFAGRTIFEARRNPQGPIALTLFYGRQRALQRIEAQRRTALRYIIALGAGPRVPRVPVVPKRIPELRRKPTYRKRRWFRGEHE